MILMPIVIDKNEVMRIIESLREEMIQVGTQEGLLSERTIMISQQLDVFIAKYQTSIF